MGPSVQLGGNNTAVWRGYHANVDGGEAFTIEPGETKIFDTGSVALSSNLPKSWDPGDRDVTISGNTSTTHGGGIGCNGKLIMGSLEKEKTFDTLSLDFHKEMVNNLGGSVELGDRTFTFKLEGEGVSQEAKSDSDGRVEFNLDGAKFLDGMVDGQEKTLNFTLTEVENKSDYPNVDFDKKNYSASIKFTATVSKAKIVGDKELTHYGAENVAVTIDGKAPSDFNVTNTLRLDEDRTYNGFGFQFNKELLTTVGNPLTVNKDQFEFQLVGQNDQDATFSAKTDESGVVRFSFGSDQDKDDSYMGRLLKDLEYKDDDKDGVDEATTELKYTLSEIKPEDADDHMIYDESSYEVKVALKVKRTHKADNANAKDLVTVTPEVTQVTFSKDGNKVDLRDGFKITNRYKLFGNWAFGGLKQFVGVGEPASEGYTFKMVELVGDPADNKLSDIETRGDAVTANAADFIDGSAEFNFGNIDYLVEGEGDDVRDDRGAHWYLVTENNDNNQVGYDPTAYVVKVNVAQDKDDLTKLNATVEDIWYADTVDSAIAGKYEGWNAEKPSVEFYNTGDSGYSLAFGCYAVNAVSNASATRKCLVDPKIVKVLEGRTMKEDEFRFKLVKCESVKETPNTTDEERYAPGAEIISQTGNDRYGMVDFDAAANVAGEGEEPSCLLFTEAGTYRYRVIEDESYNTDPSVDYSDEVITFTVTIVEDEKDGTLRNAGMYYGRLIDGVNVKCSEVTDSDFSTAATWHPTMTNKAKGSDLVVRKTSALDREMGLEGATYGLYAVSDSNVENRQADILVGQSTSDKDGWIYFENVNLSLGNLYYFKEVAAPAGHTVSEFRSSYFYVVPDESSESGYTLGYTDTKNPVATAALDSDQLLADTGATVAGVAPKSDNLLFTFTKDGGVFDEATYVEFNKLDGRTHQWVEGAKLTIVDKATGNPVVSWITGKESKVVQGNLDVDKVYILREEQAPEGYRPASQVKEVEFKLDDYGNIQVLSGTEDKNAELQGETIKLYNFMLDDERVTVEERDNGGNAPDATNNGDQNNGTGTSLPKTGDEGSPMATTLAIVALVAVAGTIFVVLARRRRS